MKTIYMQLFSIAALIALYQALNVEDNQCENPERYEHSQESRTSYSNNTFLRDYETVFVVEFMRHGARSHYEDNVPSEFFDGVKKGYLTRKGRIDQTRIGLARRNEYVIEKRFLNPDYNQHEILAIATFKQRCSDSGQYFLRGLYPLQEVGFLEEAAHHEGPDTAVHETMYQRILRKIEDLSNQCQAGPVIEVPFESDFMMHTRNCKTLHEYLNQDKFDINLLYKMLKDEFGHDIVQEIEDSLESYYLKDITNLKQYFTLVDAQVAEMYQTEHPDLRKFQRQECFILSHNFIGPESIHAEIFVSRILGPMYNLIENAKYLNLNNLPSSLKYLLITFHDTNLSNILRFIQYFDSYGYKKYVMFSSSLRFELLKDKFAPDNSPHQYRIRIVFDNQELHLPFCNETYCTYEEYDKYFKANLFLNYVDIERYCNGEIKGEFDFDVSYKKK